MGKKKNETEEIDSGLRADPTDAINVFRLVLLLSHTGRLTNGAQRAPTNICVRYVT